MASHQNGLDGLSLPVAVVVGALIIGGSILYVGSKAPAPVVTVKPAAAAPAAPVVVDISKVKTAGEPVVGAVTAPIEVAYWYDYQCPICKRAEEQVMSQMMNDYVNTGKIRVVFKNLQFLGPDSVTLGVAEKAVMEVAPTKFYAWHKAVYAAQGQERSGWATTAVIRTITEGALGKTDADRVMSLMVSKGDEYKKTFSADAAEASALLGRVATPSFIVGKQLQGGLTSYDTMKGFIDQALKQ